MEASQNAYCPYSGFRVGAALLTSEGTIFTGVNVENASYGLTICAERSAICAAITAGARECNAIAIVSSGSNPAQPCGACRQVLAEFGSPDLRVILATIDNPSKSLTFRLGELLPFAFKFAPEGICPPHDSTQTSALPQSEN